MPLRIVLIDAPSPEGWQGRSGVFDDAAQALAAQGHDVRLIDERSIAGLANDPPLLTGLNRAVAVQPMTDSHRLACELAKQTPDLIIAPLRSGIAQGALMARACGEAFAHTRIVLWNGQPTRDAFLASDSMAFDLGTMISDAMERQCLALADALIVRDGTACLPNLPGLETRLPLIVCPQKSAVGTGPDVKTHVGEIVFLGALQRAAGAGEFVEAMERLARAGLLRDRLVTFIGPMTESQYSLSKEWLGQKATAWPFRFKVVDEPDRMRALRYAVEPGRLALSVSPDSALLPFRPAAGVNGIGLLASPMGDPHLATRIVNSVSRALDGQGRGSDLAEVDWERLLINLTSLDVPPQPSATQTITVCVLHHNRLGLLRQGLASIPRIVDGCEVEVMVIDNASPIPDVEGAIREAAGDRPQLRILPLAEPLPQPSAYNRGLAEARSEIVVFLDDDNLFLAGGLERLARAASTGAHDIVVSSLEVFDDVDEDPRSLPSAGRLLFLGAAHSAGLFFNAFGDTAMAVRRKAFVTLGGFHQLGYDYPSLDWVTLAKAQGAGLRIGALQWPAVRYRRNTARADVQAVKLDEAGARALVFAACGESIDARLVARYAQKLLLLDL